MAAESDADDGSESESFRRTAKSIIVEDFEALDELDE